MQVSVGQQSALVPSATRCCSRHRYNRFYPEILCCPKSHCGVMKTTLPVALCLLSVVLLPLGECWEAPLFCHGYECPEFTVVNTYESFEERVYTSSRWITTDIASISNSDVAAGLWKLYEYTQGENTEKRVLPTTRPGLVSVNEAGENGQRQVSVSFYVAPDTVLPQPNDGTIKEITRPGGTIYVRVFSGVASESDAIENKNKLKEDLQTAGKLFDENMFDGAGYESMLILIDRHNEVWIHAA
ncbi:heme-binding protein soul2 [Colossoma macropomum]|uniref:heme-binding protein soul2 n=1 Tax=Colossoma macropomum TaxID=42526 RepID=UPI001863C5AF|nr:heme-binding protein soul2 [Colossoma macropomum]